MIVTLQWRDYRYFEYEVEFAKREVEAVLRTVPVVVPGGLQINVEPIPSAEALARLTYFARASSSNGMDVTPLQTALESSAHEDRKARQSTRYSAHGLHEYKGKFNPQVVRAIGNLLGVPRSGAILDPFCGSGTTLLESAHIGWSAAGIDRNPLAVLIANAKIRALQLANGRLEEHLEAIVRVLGVWIERLAPDDGLNEKELEHILGSNWLANLPGATYLVEWFPMTVLAQIEAFRRELSVIVPDESDRAIFDVILSNQLRQASWQEPADLRIRRRKDPALNYPLLKEFLRSAQELIPRVSAARLELGELDGTQMAILGDLRTARIRSLCQRPTGFNAAICSPPYATALPYIDTQRLSLVCLGLIEPKAIRTTEATLVGAREIATSERRALEGSLQQDSGGLLPSSVIALCREMAALAALPGNGFRRRNKPALVYRYFRDMAQCLLSVRAALRPRAPFALVIGKNRTTLGGREFAIDTPSLVADVGRHIGLELDELVSMDTYPRYGMHSRNSINEETLVVLRA